MDQQQLVLGLDLGPSSIGWALLDEQNQRVIATGVRVFPEGVDRDPSGGEQSKNQTRREKRALRRQVQRHSRRLTILRDSLVEAGLLPPDHASQSQVFRLDPYSLRTKALCEKLSPEELGRVFYHLAQRRGFLSNRKTDKTKEKDTKGMLGEIAELDAEIKASGHQTLGAYLRAIRDQQGKVRKRHTRRSMYLAEFEAIWEKQRQFHPTLLTDLLKYGVQGEMLYPADPDSHRKRASETHLQRYGLHGIIFFQRRMYWPASVIGRCELEPTEKRCPKAARLAQHFRILQEVNNLRYRDQFSSEEQKLSEEQRIQLINYLSTSKERTFESIRKQLIKVGLPESARFNLERGERGKMQGHVTDAAMASNNCLGKEWYSFEECRKNQIVHIIITPNINDTEAMEKLQSECGLTTEEAQRALNANLPEGHGQLSTKAIQKLTPFLERGYFLLGKDANDSALHAAGYIGQVQSGVEARLGSVPERITNPVVRQALIETRKVVNGLIQEYGKPSIIRIELAREAKKSFAERKGILLENRSREREREVAARRLEELGVIQPDRKAIQKYLLWEEAQHVCVYCGSPISATQLLSGEANVDHILPRWRSLDDSYMNKVLCHRACNEAKSDSTPREWLEHADPDRYHAVLTRAAALPYPKRARFTRENLELDEFVNRHLTDTAYISRQVKDYLQQLGVRVDCSKGTVTAELRHYWGLNSILNPEAGRKTRDDHRHHAIDAAVIALATPARLQQLARAHGREVQPPWPTLRDNLAESTAGMFVSHKPQRKISGALHQDTFYGPTQKLPADQRQPPAERPWAKGWQEAEDMFVRRKPVGSITGRKHLNSVRDQAIRECLINHLKQQGVDPEANSYPKGIFEGDTTPAMPSGVPIKKVRLIERLNTVRPAGVKRSFQYVQPGNNHHICYYESPTSDGNIRWTAQVTTLWDAALRVRQDGLAAIDTNDQGAKRFIMSLSIGECFLVHKEEGEPQLNVVRKIDGTGRLHYRIHTDARKAGELTSENLYYSPEILRSLQARKVAINPIGKIRNSGD